MPRIAPIPYQKLIKILQREGFKLVRERGDHMIFTRVGILRPVVVPRYNPLPVFVIKNLLRTCQISRERYFELLAEV